MIKQQTVLVVTAAIVLGMLGSGCGGHSGEEKSPAQIQENAQKSVADQAALYQQRKSSQGQPGQSAAQMQAAGMAAHYGQPGGQAR